MNRKTVLALVAPLALVSCGTTAAPRAPASMNPGEVLSSASPSTVLIDGTGCHPESGTGFVVGHSYVATAAHVVTGQQTIWVDQPSGEPRDPASVVLFDPARDVAILRVQQPLDGTPLTLAERPVPLQTRAVTIGLPLGHLVWHSDPVTREDTIVGQDIYGNGAYAHDVYTLQGHVRLGESGGPILAPSGEVLGMVVATLRGKPLYYAVTSMSMLNDVRSATRLTASASDGRCVQHTAPIAVPSTARP